MIGFSYSDQHWTWTIDSAYLSEKQCAIIKDNFEQWFACVKTQFQFHSDLRSEWSAEFEHDMKEFAETTVFDIEIPSTAAPKKILRLDINTLPPEAVAELILFFIKHHASDLELMLSDTPEMNQALFLKLSERSDYPILENLRESDLHIHLVGDVQTGFLKEPALIEWLQYCSFLSPLSLSIDFTKPVSPFTHPAVERISSELTSFFISLTHLSHFKLALGNGRLANYFSEESVKKDFLTFIDSCVFLNTFELNRDDSYDPILNITQSLTNNYDDLKKKSRVLQTVPKKVLSEIIQLNSILEHMLYMTLQNPPPESLTGENPFIEILADYLAHFEHNAHDFSFQENRVLLKQLRTDLETSIENLFSNTMLLDFEHFDTDRARSAKNLGLIFYYKMLYDAVSEKLSGSSDSLLSLSEIDTVSTGMGSAIQYAAGYLKKEASYQLDKYNAGKKTASSFETSLRPRPL